VFVQFTEDSTRSAGDHSEVLFWTMTAATVE
jgi:hypothetical protein